MKITLNDAEKSQKEISIEVPAERFKDVYADELKKLGKDAKVEGFRQGKVPADILEKKFGHQARVQALETLVNSAIGEAIEQNDIRPLSTPEVKDVKFEEDEPITFKVYVDVFPTYVVENYKGFDFTKEIGKVTKKDVDTVLDNLRDKHATFEPVEKDDAVVEDGNMVVMDFEGSKDGEVIPSATAEGYSLTIGSGTFIPGFEEQVVGMKKGETKTITVTFPEEYQEPTLAGQPVDFKITIQEIKERKLPDLDDEFAKDVDEKIESLDDLQNKIKEEMVEDADRQAKDQLFDDMLDKVIEANDFEIPETLIKDQSRKLAEQMMRQYQMYGMDPAQFGMDIDKMAESHRDTAEKQVKSALIINSIAEKNEIDVPDEELEKAIAEQAEKFDKSVDEFKKELEQYGGSQNFRNSLFTEKVYNFLVKENNVTEKKLTKKEMEERAKQAQEAAQGE